MADKFNAKLSVSDLDFDNIKNNLKDFLSKQEQFKDINFEGSGINIILDLLAYNTHYQGFYSNMIANEMFLDSAVRRDSIVSLAKHLGYTPTSITSPTATVNIITKNNEDLPDDDLLLGTIIKGTQGSSTYNFVVMETTEYKVVDGITGARDVIIKEGKLETISYVFDDTNSGLKYKIPSTADTSTLTVRVQTSTTDSTGYSDSWTQSTNFNEVEKTSKAFHIQEIENGEFEIYFGDNIVGKKPDNGNVIHIQYLNTHGPDANDIGSSDKEGARVFNYSNHIVEVISPASGGSDAETNKSIKYYAPRMYQSQDRSVTSRDYEAILLKEYSDIESVYVWGGQDNDPPEYGKVFISIKPKSGLVLDETKKQDIKNSILKSKNVVSVIPEIVDPDFLFLKISGNVVYDASSTILDKNSILSLVKSSIIYYVDNDLEKFDKDLYFSKLTKLMDSSSDSVVGSDITIKIQRRFIPIIGKETNYTLDFGNSIYHPHDGHHPVITSSGFNYKDEDDKPFTGYFDDDGNGKIRIFKYDSNGEKKYIYHNNSSIGTIDYGTGKIELEGFNPISLKNTTYLSVNAPPKNKNIFASRSQILTIDKTDNDSLSLSISKLSEKSNTSGTSTSTL